MAAIKQYNEPGKFSGLGQAGHQKGSMEKEDSGHLVSPTAFSRQTRSLKRPRKPLDRKMGSRSL